MFIVNVSDADEGILYLIVSLCRTVLRPIPRPLQRPQHQEMAATCQSAVRPNEESYTPNLEHMNKYKGLHPLQGTATEAINGLKIPIHCPDQTACLRGKHPIVCYV